MAQDLTPVQHLNRDAECCSATTKARKKVLEPVEPVPKRRIPGAAVLQVGLFTVFQFKTVKGW
jgi:hypothetical protein